MDELLQWTTALNFDDYLEGWKESATSNISEFEVEEMIADKASKAHSKLDVNYVSYSFFNEASTENKDKTQNFSSIQVPQTWKCCLLLYLHLNKLQYLYNVLLHVTSLRLRPESIFNSRLEKLNLYLKQNSFDYPGIDE